MTGAGKKLMHRMHGLMFKLPMMITCEEFEEFILAYLEDELPPRKKRVFEIHLKMCRECRAYLRAYQASMNLAKRALTEEEIAPLAEVPDDLVDAVLAARETS